MSHTDCFLRDRSKKLSGCWETEAAKQSAAGRTQCSTFTPKVCHSEKAIGENEPLSHRTASRRCPRYSRKEIGIREINVQMRSEGQSPKPEQGPTARLLHRHLHGTGRASPLAAFAHSVNTFLNAYPVPDPALGPQSLSLRDFSQWGRETSNSSTQ